MRRKRLRSFGFADGTREFQLRGRQTRILIVCDPHHIATEVTSLSYGRAGERCEGVMEMRSDERTVLAWYDTGVLIYAMLLVVFLLAWAFIPA